MKKDVHAHPRNYQQYRKKLAAIATTADDRVILKLYAFACRMIRDKVK